MGNGEVPRCCRSLNEMVQKVPFDKHKIAIAIEKAEHSSTGLYESGLAERIADEIEA